MAQTTDSHRKEQKRSLKTSILIFVIVLLLIMGVFYFLRNMVPDFMFNQGKKYLDAGQYEKALKTFVNVANAKPYDSEPIYYQALALSKMPPTYETQKALYEISQLEDCDEASELADNVLMNMRRDLENQIGPNYADNILFDDVLIRWNNSKPITFSISADSSVPPESINAVKDAVYSWQGATNGTIRFQETNVNSSTNINIRFTNDISLKDEFDPNKLGKTVPAYKDNVLQKMDVYIKKADSNGVPFPPDKVYNLVVHETGHALGLGGHSADEKDVMYYTGDTVSVPNERKNITNRDANTVMLLYRLIPDVINTPIAQSDYGKLLFHEIFTAYPGENFELETQRLISQLRANGNDIVAWVDLAINFGMRNQFARSNYILNQALPLVKNDYRNQFVVLYNMAVNYYKLKEYKTAEKNLNLAKMLNDDLDTQILETFIDVRLGRLSIAQEKLNILARTYPDNIEIALKLAEVYHIQKERKLEKETIENLIKRNPKAIRDRRVLKYKAKNKKNAF